MSKNHKSEFVNLCFLCGFCFVLLWDFFDLFVGMGGPRLGQMDWKLSILASGGDCSATA